MSAAGAENVCQIDFTEARLLLKLDPSKGLLRSFIDINNNVLNQSLRRRNVKKIGVHSCPGGDHDSTHSADIPYSGSSCRFSVRTERHKLLSGICR